MWWCLNGISRLKSLPATTSEVPMKLSTIVEYLGPFSLNVFEANLQRSVAKPSITAPANGDTCEWHENRNGRDSEKTELNCNRVSRASSKVLASPLNSLRKPCPGESEPAPATRRTARIATHNNRPSAAPTSSERRRAASFGPRPCLPCGCMDTRWSRPILVTTTRSTETGRLHKSRHQSYQQLLVHRRINLILRFPPIPYQWSARSMLNKVPLPQWLPKSIPWRVRGSTKIGRGPFARLVRAHNITR